MGGLRGAAEATGWLGGAGAGGLAWLRPGSNELPPRGALAAVCWGGAAGVAGLGGGLATIGGLA